jgi:hypothetical protein
MSNDLEGLPEDIQRRFLMLIHFHDDGTWECPDRRAFVDFILDNADAHPALLEFVCVDEERLMRHVRETGDVPPGIKIIKTSTAEGDNVTQLRVFHGPKTIPEDERS